MTTTARIASTTSQDSSYTGSVALGDVANFIAIGKMEPGESVVFEGSNGAGSIYEPITYVDAGGNQRVAELNSQNRTILLQGPLDFRINKSATAAAVEVAEYS
jgi:hypothetical protein